MILLDTAIIKVLILTLNSLYFQDLSMIAPTTASSRGIDQPLAAPPSTVEPAILDQESKNASETVSSSANNDDYDTDDDAEFWNEVIQEEEQFRTANNPTVKKDSTTTLKDTSRKSPSRATSKALKRKSEDPRSGPSSKKECPTSDKNKKGKRSKRRRVSKRALYDYRASLKLGTSIVFAHTFNKSETISFGKSCHQLMSSSSITCMLRIKS